MMRLTHPANGGKLNEMDCPRLTISYLPAPVLPADCDVPPHPPRALRISHYPLRLAGLHACSHLSFGRTPNPPRSSPATPLRKPSPQPKRPTSNSYRCPGSSSPSSHLPAALEPMPTMPASPRSIAPRAPHNRNPQTSAGLHIRCRSQCEGSDADG